MEGEERKRGIGDMIETSSSSLVNYSKKKIDFKRNQPRLVSRAGRGGAGVPLEVDHFLRYEVATLEQATSFLYFVFCFLL
jgi:hypothetical protein